ncbi:tyrosine-type recombinase/integrase [Pseudactinotalea sp. Z1739]|uniref:tyrosine-type recombinase/integrase n=1 Tax=Pseudactinotalea sp. Z1739 TaxID=3413028 RepID=UPI003C7A0055
MRHRLQQHISIGTHSCVTSGTDQRGDPLPVRLRHHWAARLRIGETLALTENDIDLDAEVPVVHVRATVVPASGKGLIRQVEPKSSASRRTVPATTDAITAIRKALSLGMDGGPLHLLFPNLSGGLRQPGNVRTDLGRIVEGTDLEWVTTHTMRKTVVTRVAHAHGSTVAAAILGQSGTATAERHYIARLAQAPDVRATLETGTSE